MRWLYCSLIAGGLIAAADIRPAWGWPTQLSLDIEQAASSARTNAILPLTFRIHHNGTGVLEGEFVCFVSGGEGVPGQYRQHVVLNPGQNRFGGTVRTFSSLGRDRQISLRAAFVSSQGGTTDLGTHAIRVADILSRRFVIAVCETEVERQLPTWQDFAGHLRFEQFNADRNRRQGSTSLAHIDPVDLPENALELCAYDLVLISPIGLSELKDKPLQAIVAWVKAGGSVCVVPTAPIDQRHVRFLNELIEENPKLSPFVINTAGRIVSPIPAEQESDARLLAYKGLGTAAILLRDTSARRSYSAADWRLMVTFLWKYRVEQQADVLRRGNWTVPAFPDMTRTPYGYQSGQSQLNVYKDADGRDQIELAPTPGGNLSRLIERLIPDGLRVVPFSLMGLILAGYVALIGPVDYFLLGWIKKRKWTWFTFPLVTAGMAAFTIWLIESYMSTPDNRKAVVILDVDAKGKVLRVNRFDLLFTSGNRTVESEVRHALFVPFNSDSAYSYEYYAGNPYGYGGPRRGGSSGANTVTYSGQFPLRYTVTQGVEQWTPQLNRRMFIAPADEPPAQGVEHTFDWGKSDDVIERGEKPKGKNQISALVGRLFIKATNVKTPQAPTSGWQPAGQKQQRNAQVQQRNALVQRITKGFGTRVSAFLLAGGSDAGSGPRRLTRIIGNLPLFDEETTMWGYGWQTINTPSGPQKVYIQPPAGPQPAFKAPAVAQYAVTVNDEQILPDDLLTAMCVQRKTGLFTIVSSMSPVGSASLEDLAMVDVTDPQQTLLVVAVQKGDELIIYRHLYRSSAE